MVDNMKIYAGNTILAQQLLETTFALMCNERQRPVEIMKVVYQLLTSAIDISYEDQEALHDYLQLVTQEYNTSSRAIVCN